MLRWSDSRNFGDNLSTHRMPYTPGLDSRPGRTEAQTTSAGRRRLCPPVDTEITTPVRGGSTH
jgi:hypothetical protein